MEYKSLLNPNLYADDILLTIPTLTPKTNNSCILFCLDNINCDYEYTDGTCYWVVSNNVKSNSAAHQACADAEPGAQLAVFETETKYTTSMAHLSLP